MMNLSLDSDNVMEKMKMKEIQSWTDYVQKDSYWT